MSSGNNGFGGFNTVNHSNLPRREEKARRQRMAILSLFAVIAVMVVVGIIILISVFGDSTPKDPTKADLVKNMKYEEISVTADDVVSGDLVLVNSEHEYVFPTDESHLVNVVNFFNKTHPDTKPYVLGQPGVMDSTALIAADKLLTAFYEETGNDTLKMNEAYRTAEQQSAIGSIIPAGQSDHHTGLGFTLKAHLSGGTENIELDPIYDWVAQHAHEYGFIVRYPVDKVASTGISGYTYYFRYVGIPHATYMHENNLSLEEYIDHLRTVTYDKEHIHVLGSDGKTYEIYYSDAEAGNAVKVPAQYNYTISGTNAGGVVITVDTTSKIN